MVKKIKPPPPQPTRHSQGVPAIPLPFPPTNNPGHEHVLAASNTVLMMVQALFQGNPRAVITALKAAEHAYITAISNEGMPEKEIEDQEVLGIQLAAIMLRQAEEAKKQAESEILQPNTGLVGPDGRPLVSVPSTDQARETLAAKKPQMHPGPSAREEQEPDDRRLTLDQGLAPGDKTEATEDPPPKIIL